MNCGTHEPVLPGGDEIAAAERVGMDGRRVRRAACVAGAAVVVGALLG